MSKIRIDSYHVYYLQHFFCQKTKKKNNKGGGALHNLPTVRRSFLNRTLFGEFYNHSRKKVTIFIYFCYAHKCLLGSI